MINKGLLPIPKHKRNDPRTHDFHRTFGTVSLDVIPQEFNFDYMGQAGIFPDQNADGYPNGCTAYTTTGMASNNEKIDFDDKNFTYSKTKLMMGVEGDVPCDQMTALKSATVYGMRKKGQGDADALAHRQAPYFIVKKLNGSYFDGALSAMWKKQGTLSVGTPWYPIFETVGADGLIPPFTPQGFDEGHNWEATGVKLINGEQYLICKSWQGKRYGNGGYAYFSKKQFDSLLSVPGIGIFGQKKLEPGQEIQTVKITIIETILNFMYQLLTKLQFGFSNLGVYFGSRTFGAARSSHWGAVREAHLKISPNCVICGSSRVNVHHIRPFHLNPTLELDPTNLITLCDGLGTKNHHIEFGHFFSWKSWNENVVEDAKLWNGKIATRP